MLAFALLSVSLCGCSDKTALTSEQFIAIMSAKGYRIEDHTEYLDPQLPSSEDAERIKAYGDYCVCFDKLKDSETVLEHKDIIKKYYDTFAKSETVFPYDSYLQYSTDEKIYIVSCVGNTYITIETDIAYRDSVLDLINELGYGK